MEIRSARTLGCARCNRMSYRNPMPVYLIADPVGKHPVSNSGIPCAGNLAAIEAVRSRAGRFCVIIGIIAWIQEHHALSQEVRMLKFLGFLMRILVMPGMVFFQSCDEWPSALNGKESTPGPPGDRLGPGTTRCAAIRRGLFPVRVLPVIRTVGSADFRSIRSDRARMGISMRSALLYMYNRTETF